MTFDIIGSKEKAVATIEKDGKLAKEIMKSHKNVKSVLQKTSGRKGIHRIYKLKLLAGSKNTEVVHREYGCLFKVDPRKVYFSPREAEERQRIAKKVKKGEKILVIFSGIAPYAVQIAKIKKCDITCVEINKKAVEYANENLKLNRLTGKIENINDDIRAVYKRLGKFDRIIMPLAEGAYLFLDTAFFCSKKGTIIHLYGISKDFKDFIEKVKHIAKKYKKRIKILEKQKVSAYAPRTLKVRIDIKII